MKKQKQQPIDLDDLMGLAQSAFGFLSALGQEASAHLATRRDMIVSKLDLVPRETFDAAFATLKTLRAKQNDLERRIERLEGKKSVSSPQRGPAKKQIRRKK